jgi:hypothetical protein
VSGSFTREEIVISESALRDATSVALRFIQDNSRARVNKHGEPLPPGVDLFASGDLLFYSVDVDVEKDRGVITFRVPYAEIVEARYEFAGIPPQRWQEFEAQIGPILAKGASLRSKP